MAATCLRQPVTSQIVHMAEAMLMRSLFTLMHVQDFEAVYEGEEKRYKAARLLPGHEYRVSVKVITGLPSQCMFPVWWKLLQ